MDLKLVQMLRFQPSMPRMPSAEMPAKPAAIDVSFPQEGRLDLILAKIDLVAIVVTLLGISLLGMAATAFAFIELAKLVSNLWSDPLVRWLMICLALAIIWVTVRWKKSRLS